MTLLPKKVELNDMSAQDHSPVIFFDGNVQVIDCFARFRD